jgi:hypothetical protein
MLTAFQAEMRLKVKFKRHMRAASTDIPHLAANSAPALNHAAFFAGRRILLDLKIKATFA